jgi:hypothetical protein
MFFFCSQLSIFTSTILSLFILNAFFTFSFTPISPSNYSSTIFSSIIFILSIQSASSACHFILFLFSLTAANSFLSSPFSSITAANSFLSTLFSYLIPTASSLISLIMVFISLSICLLLFPSSLLLEDPPVLELFQNGFVLSSDVLPFSLSLWLLSFFRFGSFGMPSLSCPLPFAYHLSLTNEKHLKKYPSQIITRVFSSFLPCFHSFLDAILSPLYFT